MARPIIGYNNIFSASGVTVSASSEVTGFEKENAFDWRSDGWWKPSSGTTHYLRVDYGSNVSADCIALMFHDLDTQGATVKVNTYTGAWTGKNTEHTVTLNGDACTFEAFTSASSRYWEIEVTLGAAGQPIIGMAFLGAQFELPHGLQVGWRSIYDNHKSQIINNRAQSGAFVGRTLIKQGVVGELSFKFMTETILRGAFRTFLTHAETKPFFFNRNPGTYDDESLMLWMEPDGLRAPSAAHTLPYYEASMRVEGVKE